MKFTIKCVMDDKWVSPFLSMLKFMEHCGDVGQSRSVCILADGDGDFRPKFDTIGFIHKDPVIGSNGEIIFDIN